MEEITGCIENIVYADPIQGFTVARLKSPDYSDLQTVIGNLPHIHPGETLYCKGKWVDHSSHGTQFSVIKYRVVQPSDIYGIQKYLESGLVKGIGPVYAKKIVQKFGKETLSIIDQTPTKLLQIEGLGEKKLKKIIACWKEQSAIREVMVFLQGHGVSPAYAQKIFKYYGEFSITKVQENPYQLAKDIFGIGFKMADQIAQNMGFCKDSPERIQAGILHILWETSQEGHTCFPKEDLEQRCTEILEVDFREVSKGFAILLETKQIVEKEPFIWLKKFDSFEKAISYHIHRISQAKCSIREILLEKAVQWAGKKQNIQFALEQIEAIKQALQQKIQIITGGPGTGKSTITKAILSITEKITSRILLAAPTGRAAKRLTQITRKKAFTIHALLEYDFSTGGFKRNVQNPLQCDLIIIDEASMIDTQLMFFLLQAIPNHARVIFIGDVDQLPSVGPGFVLNDLIASNVLSITKLKEIFRQAKGSQIIVNAHRINMGNFPFLGQQSWSDFHFYEANEPIEIQQKILALVAKELPKKYRFDPIQDIQVLCPMKRGVIGSELFNQLLQETLNPSDQPFYRASKRLHINDKVMQIKNNYQKHVYNGDIGTIVHIDLIEQQITVGFDEKMVNYEFSQLDEITLAYAVSIHKYQGSESPCVIIPIHTSHFKLLHRNLLYTGVTRGKKRVILVGSKKAIAIAVKNNEVEKRHTGLKTALHSQETMLPGFKF